jgi:glycerol kinase
MAIVTRWDNKKKTIVLLEFESEWSWNDLEEAVQQADALIGSVDHFVDLIIDLEGSSIPKDVLNAAQTLLASGSARPNEGVRVVVGANGTMRTIYQTLQKTFGGTVDGREILFAPTLSDARAIIRGVALDR